MMLKHSLCASLCCCTAQLQAATCPAHKPGAQSLCGRAPAWQACLMGCCAANEIGSTVMVVQKRKQTNPKPNELVGTHTNAHMSKTQC